MKNLLIKEFRLASSPLSYIFLAGAIMTMIPNYPILVGSFFICFGVFHSFQSSREYNDVLYSTMLPIKKSDFVKAKFIFTVLIQISGFIFCAVLTVVRMTLLSGSVPYANNAMMNATPYYLSFVLLIFTAFNTVFIGNFFKTAYKIGIPFLLFGIAAFLIIGIAETIHHLPGLSFLNAPAGEKLAVGLLILFASVIVYAAATVLSCRKCEKTFEKIDL